MPPQLMAAGWTGKTDRRSSAGDLGASEPRELELLTHRTCLSPAGSELKEGRNERQRHLAACTWGRCFLPRCRWPRGWGSGGLWWRGGLAGV